MSRPLAGGRTDGLACWSCPVGTPAPHRPFRRPVPVLLAILAVALRPAPAGADLAGTLHRFVERNGALVRNGVFDALSPVLERLAVRGTDLPPVATALGFVYHYDPDTGAMRREAGPLGAVFLDRPRTLGQHVLAIGALYEHADLTRYDGRELAPQVVLRSRVTFRDGSRLLRRLAFTDLDVTADVVNLSATWGVTDAWDVNLLLPVAATTLDAAAEERTVSGEPGQPPRRSLRVPSASTTTAGPEDLLLR